MLPFFRKIRWKLASDNPPAGRAGQFLKYSRYAIGEILLVVIGILIALYINNWNEDRKVRQEVNKMLMQLKTEYQENLEQLDQKIAMRKEISRSCERMLDYIDEPDQIQNDSLIYYLFRLTQDPTFDPIQNDLISSGFLRLTRNEELSKLLSNWTSEIYVVQELELSWQNIRNESVMPLILNKGFGRDLSAYLLNKGYTPDYSLDKDTSVKASLKKSKVDIKKAFVENQTQLEGMAAICILYHNITNEQSDDLKNRILRILTLIDEELEES